jgi:predicted nucleic acid-binding protein
MQLVAPLPVIWPSKVDCDQTLLIFQNYHLSHNLGLLDALIAACALSISATLCTFNVKHYRMISTLVTAQPYKR